MKPTLFSPKSGKHESSGYFGVFEGQDGSGKTTIMEAVGERLKTQGHEVVLVPEFSTSIFGLHLIDSVAQDKFLRTNTPHPAFLTQVFAFITDWMHMTEHEIAPALQRGAVVLKDRYEDSQVVCQIPTLLQSYSGNGRRVQDWFEAVTSINPIRPDKVFYMEVDEPTRISRLQSRERHLKEARGNTVSKDDLSVFRARDRLFLRRIQANPGGYAVIQNTDPISVVTGRVTERIIHDMFMKKGGVK